MVKDKIVVGVDAAWRRAGALDWALREAARRRMPLRAVHVVDERVRQGDSAPVRVDGQVIVPASIPKVDRRLVDELEAYLVAAGDSLDLDTDVLIGAPDKRLAELSSDAELTVVGRRGVGEFARLLLGSTSEYVATHGDGPVVVVPAGWRPEAHTRAPVVVGVDGYEDDGGALEFAFEMAAAQGAALMMVLAWDVPAPYTWDPTTSEMIREDWKRKAKERLDSLADQWQHKYPDVKVERTLQQSHAAVALLETAELAGAQLIVIGGHRHRMPGVMLGSVSRGVLHHATVPVAVVHEHTPAS